MPPWRRRLVKQELGKLSSLLVPASSARDRTSSAVSSSATAGCPPRSHPRVLALPGASPAPRYLGSSAPPSATHPAPPRSRPGGRRRGVAQSRSDRRPRGAGQDGGLRFEPVPNAQMAAALRVTHNDTAQQPAPQRAKASPGVPGQPIHASVEKPSGKASDTWGKQSHDIIYLG